MDFYIHYFSHNVNATISIIVAVLMMAGVSVWLILKKSNWIFLLTSWLLFLTVLIIGFNWLIREDSARFELWEEYLCDMTKTFAKSTQELGHDQIRPDQDYNEVYDRIINLHTIWCRDLHIIGYVFTLRLIGPEQVEFICSCPSDIDGDGKTDKAELFEEGDPPFTHYVEEGEYAWYNVYARGFAGEIALDPEVESTDYGRWVTAVSPLYNSKGEVEAVLGVDFRVEQWEAHTGTLRNRSLALLNAILLILFLGIVSYAHLRRSLIVSRGLNESLRFASQHAQAASAAKSEFLAKMSHEIRTPISGVIGLSDLLDGTELDPKQHEYVQLIKTSGQTLLFLINDILDFSKIEAGKLELDTESFDVVAMVESIMGVLAARAEEKRIELCALFETDLPLHVIGDSGRIRQILLNLTANAVKFTECGGVSIRVTAEQHSADQISVRFTVKDTGIGIPKDHIDHLFTAFSQVDSSSSRAHGGTGLGLVISLQLVKLMQGTIGVETVHGHGSEFWFRIPLGCDPRVIDCLQNPEQECAWSPETREFSEQNFCFGTILHRKIGVSQLKEFRVLISGNHEIVRQNIREQLSVWKMLPDEVVAPNDTLEKLVQAKNEQRPYTLLIVGSDVGKALIRQIRATPAIKDTAIILTQPLTAESDQQFFTKYSVTCVRKPIFVSALFDAVKDQLFRDNATGSTVSPPLPTDVKPRRKLTEPIHILVAEDNRVNQIVIQNVLNKVGLTCEVVNNGHEALQATMSRQFDVILMDCQMPEIDGYEATDLIRKWERDQNRSRMPIIALTANAVAGDEQKCLDAGMDAYCHKPVNPVLVIEAIEHWYEFSKMGEKQ